MVHIWNFFPVVVSNCKVLPGQLQYAEGPTAKSRRIQMWFPVDFESTDPDHVEVAGMHMPAGWGEIWLRAAHLHCGSLGCMSLPRC